MARLPAGPLSVLDASASAIVGVDAQGAIVYANPRVAETFGWQPQELLGQPVERLLPDALAETHRAHRTGYLAHPTARPMGINLDLQARRRDGSTFPVEISLAPIATPDGLQVYATVVDITPRKALEGQLLQAQKMESIGRLAGGIAHDFNNMLFAIRGYADLLLEDLTPERFPELALDEVRGSVEAISQAADRAAALTAQLLAFSRRQAIRPESLDARAAVAGIEPMLRRLIGEQVRLRLRLDPATGIVRLDAGQFDQILVNLVVNARDAVATGGTITIETANVEFDEPYAMEHFDVAPGAYVMLAVSDDGVGMDRETRAHVFEPFFTTKAPGGGTGLGLATIYGIVRQGGGHIWLYSEPGRGTTFKLYFPRVDAVETVTAAPARGGQTGRGRVLLVEDEPAVRELSRRVLERAGHVVLVAPDAQAALAIVRDGRSPVDVLVTDVVMPGMFGPDLAREVLRLRPDVGVVLLSGYTSETLEMTDLIERGAVFASKPLAPRALAQAVADALTDRSTR